MILIQFLLPILALSVGNVKLKVALPRYILFQSILNFVWLLFVHGQDHARTAFRDISMYLVT